MSRREPPLTDREALLASLEDTNKARDEDVTYFASCNACTAGVDITVSWSDGEPGTPPKGAMLLALSWDNVADLALRYGRSLNSDSVATMADAVAEHQEGDVSVAGGGE